MECMDSTVNKSKLQVNYKFARKLFDKKLQLFERHYENKVHIVEFKNININNSRLFWGN